MKSDETPRRYKGNCICTEDLRRELGQIETRFRVNMAEKSCRLASMAELEAYARANGSTVAPGAITSTAQLVEMVGKQQRRNRPSVSMKVR